MSLVLSPEDFRILDGLRLNPRKSFSGRVRGERLTRKKGISIEFADYRDYTEGDDLRHLDWNVLGRLQTAVIKTYQDEEDLAVYLIVDITASMAFGEPQKQRLAKTLACALGYIALSNQDAAYPVTLPMTANPTRGANGVGAALRGRSNYPKLARWTCSIPESANGGLANSLRDFVKASARPGVVVLLTDALDPEMPTVIRVLGGRGHEVCLIQILAPEEIDPDLEGDLRLLDAESNEIVEITANRDALEGYRKNLAAHNEALHEACHRVGGRYISIPTNQPLEWIVKEKLRREGWFAI